MSKPRSVLTKWRDLRADKAAPDVEGERVAGMLARNRADMNAEAERLAMGSFQRPDKPPVTSFDLVQDQSYYEHNANGTPIVSPHKAVRRIDRLQWLLDHGTIAEYQLKAGRKLQEDWQISKIEPAARSGGLGGGPSSTLSDAKLDAGTRVSDAMAVLPQQLVTLATHFLLPEDHPYSLEKCAAIVRIDRKAASFGIQISLTLLARHYGYCS